MLYPMDAAKNSCDTFICYRANTGAAWGKIIYDWMENDRNNHYGQVYYSQFVPNANFLNDISPMITTARNIIVVVIDEFTRNFPRTKKDFDTRQIITAQEIHTIMGRMRTAREQAGRDMPRLILLHPGKFNAADQEAFTRLASDYGQRSEPEMTDWLVNQFMTAGIHEIDARASDALIRDHLRDYLSATAMISDLTRFTAATRTRIEALPFKLIPQTIHLQGTHTSISDLAHSLIHRDPDGAISGRLAVISGDGGMGKTTQLLNLCHQAQQKALTNYDPGDTLHLYLPAHRLNDYADSPSPLYAALAKALGFHSEPYQDKEGFHPADYTDPEEFIKGQVFANPCGTPCAPCLLCIDGLDEIENVTIRSGCRTLLDHLVCELPAILSLGVAVILTSRSSTLFRGGIFTACTHGRMNPLENMMYQLPPQFRPALRTRLARLLETPFYFTMYYHTVSQDTAPDSEDIRTARKLGDLYHQDMERYYHHTDPTVPGELIWNYMMRHIVKRAGQSLSIQPNDCRRIFFLMGVLPRIAAAYLSRHPLSEEKLMALYGSASARFLADGWCPFWKLDRLPTYTAAQMGSMPSLQDFLRFSTIEFPVLRREEQPDRVTYRFSHALMLEFFAACEIINTIAAIFRDPDRDPGGILPLREQPMPPAILKLVGEICGERRGTPYFDEENGVWHSPCDKTNNLVRRSLNSIRNAANSAILVNNLVSVLKYARTEEDRLPDLSGIDFSGLDMTKCALNQILFSHHAPDSSLCARFTGAKFDPIASFSEGHRAIAHQLSIPAMIEWQPRRLLSVDEAGCCVLWDVSMGLILDVLHLKDDRCKHCISEMTTDGEGHVWVACDNELFCLRLSSGRDRVSIVLTRRIPTSAVKHLGWRKDIGLYYHSVASPLTRRLADGRQAAGHWDSRWFPDAVVNRRGDTAFFLKGSPTKYSFQSVGDIMCQVWDEAQGIWEERVFFSERDLQNLTGYPFFEYGHLFLSPDEKTLLLCLSCRAPIKPMQAVALEFDLEKFSREHTEGQLKRYYSPVSSEGAGIHSGCFGANQVYFSSYLSIYSVNPLQESRMLHAGEGRLLHAQFLPGTFRFFTITDNPIRIHVFASPTIDHYRCVSQIVPTGIRTVKGVVQAFQFLPDMVFQHHDSQGYAEHPRQLRLLLQHERAQLFEVDLSNGLTREHLSEGTVLIKDPVVSHHKDNWDAFSMTTDKQAIRIHFLDPDRAAFSIALHPGWLFAGCNFDDADFGGQDAPDQFAHYIQGPALPADTPEELLSFDDESCDSALDFNFYEEDYLA